MTNDNDDGRQLMVSSIKVYDITYGIKKSAKDFSLHLIPKKHGLYDMLEMIYDQVLTKLTDGRHNIDSNLWTFTYNGIDYVPHIFDEQEVTENGGNKKVLDPRNPRIFFPIEGDSFSIDGDYKPLKFERKTKGCFSLDNDPLKFSFEVEEVNLKKVKNVKVEWETNYPKIVHSNTKRPTANPGADDYINNNEKVDSGILRMQYENYMTGLNEWKEAERDPGERIVTFVPCKPKLPPWAPKEDEIIDMFLSGGWKFAQSWKSGMQWAFPHRTKAATQQRWYVLRGKYSYMLSGHKSGLSKSELIIKGKEFCSKMMKKMIDHGPPQRAKRPRDIDFDNSMEAMFLCETVKRGKDRIGQFLPDFIRPRGHYE